MAGITIYQLYSKGEVLRQYVDLKEAEADLQAFQQGWPNRHASIEIILNVTTLKKQKVVCYGSHLVYWFNRRHMGKRTFIRNIRNIQEATNLSAGGYSDLIGEVTIKGRIMKVRYDLDYWWKGIWVSVARIDGTD